MLFVVATCWLVVLIGLILRTIVVFFLFIFNIDFTL